MPNSKPPYGQLALLSLLLIVAPLGSYLYLKRGYEYRYDSLQELVDLGRASSIVEYGTAIEASTIDVLFFSPVSQSDSVALAIKSLHEAFDKQELVQFASLARGSNEWLPVDAQQATLTRIDDSQLAGLDEMSSQDAHCITVPLLQRAMVVDTSGTLRRCYDLHQGQDVNRIVEQINILLPRPPKEDVFFQQEQEY